MLFRSGRAVETRGLHPDVELEDVRLQRHLAQEGEEVEVVRAQPGRQVAQQDVGRDRRPGRVGVLRVVGVLVPGEDEDAPGGERVYTCPLCQKELDGWRKKLAEQRAQACMQALAQAGVPASQLFMPLSFASILGGTCTMMGTSTNLIVKGLLEESEHYDGPPLGIFSLGLVGVQGAPRHIDLARLPLLRLVALVRVRLVARSEEHTSELQSP